MMVSLDGFFEGPNHDLSWHHVDSEFNDFAINQLKEADTLVMGRKTYQLMESFWPSKAGREEDPQVAQAMNFMPKIVISRSLKNVEEKKYWKNISLIEGNIKEEITRIKKERGKDLVVLASSNLCISLLNDGLLDELRIMVNPVAIGKGTRLFDGIKKKLNLELIKTRKFGNGNVLLYYKVK